MDWKKDLNEAKQYARAVNGMIINRKVDNETLYHIICLSVEKFTSSLAGMQNYIPMNSGITFIFRELKKMMDFPENFMGEARFLNGFMTYCSLNFEKPKFISETDLTRMIVFLCELESYAEIKQTSLYNN
jgi:hypothetical protein